MIRYREEKCSTICWWNLSLSGPVPWGCDLHRYFSCDIVPPLPLLPFLAAALLFPWSPDTWGLFHPITFRRQKEASLGRNLGWSFRIVLWPHLLPWRVRPLLWGRLDRFHNDYSSTSSCPIFTLGIWWGFWRGRSESMSPLTPPPAKVVIAAPRKSQILMLLHTQPLAVCPN